MAIWISNPDSDPVLRRGEALGRYGSAIPALTLCAGPFTAGAVALLAR